MKRSIIIIAGLLVALAVGGGIGYLAGRNNSPAPERGLGQNPADLSNNSNTDRDDNKSDEDWQQWKYPGCAEHESSLGGGGQLGTARVPPHFCLVLTTQDDYEKVLRFYADKTGTGLTGGGSGTTANGNSKDANMESWFVMNDSLSPEGANRNRPVKTKMFGKRTPRYDLTMFFSRANDEKHTHMLLVYYPRE
ncbi:MAG: hypothetical protein ABSG53_11680 [Thermoguttaceae bacterium]|jgi:hypothetical protein